MIRQGRISYEFTVGGARLAAAAGQVDRWVHAFLTNGTAGTNLPMAAGLRKQQRWWIGPVRIELASLTRICGPEPEMAYRTPVESWEEHVSAIAAAAGDPEALPPLILEYRGTSLALCDGNHRHEALRRCGETHVWALVWCNSESAFMGARDQLEAGT
jgi:hypothetical protein